MKLAHSPDIQAGDGAAMIMRRISEVALEDREVVGRSSS
jgi:hypothetical protein